jgi:nuclear-control-of-ATPase protein 2
MVIPPDYATGLSIPFFGRDNKPHGSDNLNVIDPHPNQDVQQLPVGGRNIENNNIPLMATVAAPIIGPEDAPHLRYVPSYFSTQLPERLKQLFPTVMSTFHSARSKLYTLLWFKPPVGILGAWCSLRIVQKMSGLYNPPPPTSGEEALEAAEDKLRGMMMIKSILPSALVGRSSGGGGIGSSGRIGGAISTSSSKFSRWGSQTQTRKRKRKFRRGRSFDLDKGDQSYDNFGGIETVRVRAYQEGLKAALEEISNDDDDGSSSNTSLFGNKQSVEEDDTSNLSVKEDVQTALNALQLLCPPKGSREYFVQENAQALSKLANYIAPSSRGDKTKTPTVKQQNIDLLLHHSSKLIEMRTLDALLRTLRDRHLIVASRLRRARDYWKWHVNLSGGWFGLFTQDVRQKVYSVFPWLGINDFRERNQRDYEKVTASWERELVCLGKVEQLLLDRPEEMEVGSLLSVTKDNDGEETSWLNNLLNGGTKSKPSLDASAELILESKNRKWIRETEDWCTKARKAVGDSLDEVVTTKDVGALERSEAQRFLNDWASYDATTESASSWLTALSIVEYAGSPRRPGEQRYFQLSTITSQVKRFDFLGIPSSVLILLAANMFHDRVVAPHKQEMIDFAKSVFQAIWGVIEFRFYIPLKDIILDLLNRRPRMVDPFALSNEQTSLDNMLRDLGVGDGTRENRALALASASRMYEEEVAGGAIRGIVRGKVAQLMLIQIQQLKADLLQAMDTIDDLVDANRLNVQLIAGVPALLIVTYGTRAAYLFWSNIRMKNFRLPHDVHSEMSDCLKKVEECLVLSNYQLDAKEGQEQAAVNGKACLKPKEMGQLLLLLHSYLNLLDYMSPPFPSKQCNSIHQSVQNLLLQGQMSTARQLDLLKVIQSKNDELLKFI